MAFIQNQAALCCCSPWDSVLTCIAFLVVENLKEPICSGVLEEEWEHMEPPSHKDTDAFLSATCVLFHSDHQMSAGTQTRAPMGTTKHLSLTSEHWVTV